MLLGSRLGLILLWQIRVTFQLLVWLASCVGETMVALAGAFRACRRASVEYGLFVIPVQMALLLAWAPSRALFLALEGTARLAHRTHVDLHRRRTAIA